MGVPMHSRVYQALGGLTLLAGYGVALHAWRDTVNAQMPSPNPNHDPKRERDRAPTGSPVFNAPSPAASQP